MVPVMKHRVPGSTGLCSVSGRETPKQTGDEQSWPLQVIRATGTARTRLIHAVLQWLDLEDARRYGTTCELLDKRTC